MDKIGVYVICRKTKTRVPYFGGPLCTYTGWSKKRYPNFTFAIPQM